MPEVLKPLRTFLASAAPRLQPPARAAWAADVAAAVCRLYLALASSTLDTVRKNEEALKRLRGGGGGAGGGAGQASAAGPLTDSHKICVQLCLDVAGFGAQLQELGVEAAALPAYQQLQETVRPDEELLANALGGGLE